MEINTPKQAMAVANQLKTCRPGACQAYVRGYFKAPSVGDYDGDGAADAEDGGKSEPQSARHTDRTGRAGYPATFFGGRLDQGHRALFVKPGIVRSTDFNGLTKRYDAGNVGNGTVAEVEAAMSSPGHPVKFVFWSTTIDGQPIPPDPTKKKHVGRRVKEMRRLAKHVNAVPGTKRFTWLQKLRLLLGEAPGN